MNKTFTPDSTSKVRLSDRASYDWELIGDIIDDNPIGHVAFMDQDEVFIIPLNVWRMGDYLYLHCLKGGRLERVLSTKQRHCISFAEHNAWVLSKSAYHTSANYRSVVVYGHFSEVSDDAEFTASFARLLNMIEEGRWDKVRPISKKERKATSLLRFTITMGSAKSRSGKAKEEEADLQLAVPAGIIPLSRLKGTLQEKY